MDHEHVSHRLAETLYKLYPDYIKNCENLVLLVVHTNNMVVQISKRGKEERWYKFPKEDLQKRKFVIDDIFRAKLNEFFSLRGLLKTAALELRSSLYQPG